MAEPEIVFYQKSPEGGYKARAMGHSIFTQAETLNELMMNAKDAIACHFPDRNPLPVARLVEARTLGSAKGEFTVPDDFNDPLPKELEDLFWE